MKNYTFSPLEILRNLLLANLGSEEHLTLFAGLHGANNHIGCDVLDLPDNEFEHHSGQPADCMNFWFSNGIKIPGLASIPEDLAQTEVTCTGQAGHHDNDKKFPSNAPATGPSLDPCGTLGGIPLVSSITVTALLLGKMQRTINGTIPLSQSV